MRPRLHHTPFHSAEKREYYKWKLKLRRMLIRIYFCNHSHPLLELTDKIGKEKEDIFLGGVSRPETPSTVKSFEISKFRLLSSSEAIW
jgi:hypothetical protein